MNHEEWLRKSYESILKSAQTGDCEKDECEPAESENAAPTDTDSRERLERDIRGSLGFTTKDVFGWLDRQASITCAERDRHWMEIVGANANANLELKRQIDELQERSCPGYEIESHRCRWHDADFELNTTKLNDLKRENSRLEKRVRELEEDNDHLQRKMLGLEDEVISLESDRDDLIDQRDSLEKRISELEKRVWIAEETVSAREIKRREERDYWRGQFRACLGAAAKDGYALGLLKYPRPNNLIEPFVVVTNCIDELRDQLADEKRARAEASWERDHWRETAGRLSDEIPLDEKLIEQRMVLEREMDRIVQSHAENLPETPDFAENPQKTPEQRREIVAKDGKPIRIGETLTGEDGIAWTVKGFNREPKYPVIGASCLETRDLKPEWLTHKFNEQHICDTCRFYVHVGDGTGDCHRWPREFVKDPDDWCGEWSE